MGISGRDGSLILCDSQLSTQSSEIHGAQKLFAGEGFIIGGAGLSVVITDLFAELGSTSVDATSVIGAVETYFETRLSDNAREAASFLLATEHREGGIQHFWPEVFRRFQRRTNMEAIGSGAEFVGRALTRDAELGIDWPRESIADMLIMADQYFSAANESLTVDDQIMVGFVSSGRSYLMGDRRIGPAYAPATIVGAWPSLTTLFEEIMAIVRAVRGEFQAGARQLSRLASCSIDPSVFLAVSHHQNAMVTNRAALEVRVNAYMTQYDTIMGR
ncbi:MAG: hypothetical protein R3F14_45345 [Polyangiaceae bacterium]